MTNANKKNPFGLTTRQCELMEALIEHGSPKAIAAHEDVTEKTARNTLRTAINKMGVSTYVQAAIKYDRLRMGCAHVHRAPSSVFYLGKVVQ